MLLHRSARVPRRKRVADLAQPLYKPFLHHHHRFGGGYAIRVLAEYVERCRCGRVSAREREEPLVKRSEVAEDERPRIEAAACRNDRALPMLRHRATHEDVIELAVPR